MKTLSGIGVTGRAMRRVVGRATAWGVLLAVMSPLGLAGTALAWNAKGHSTIDLLAYRELTAETRAKLDTILHAHPRYKQDLLRDKPEGVSEEEYAFTRAGTWPDIVRDQSNPMHAAYHKASWHYTTVPYFPEGREEKYRVEASRPEKPGQPYDSISAWKYNLDRLNDESVPLSERAVSLCWVLHLGGDIHQPCHNTSVFSAKFPEGDRGANLWIFMDGERRRNLHSFWDGWLGDDAAWAKVAERAEELAKAHPKAEFEKDLAVTDAATWVQEGRFLAIRDVYLDGKLVGVSQKEAGREGENPNVVIPQLSEEYRKNAIRVSYERGSLGAWRISQALNGLALPGVPAAVKAGESTGETTTGAATRPVSAQ